MLGIITEGIRNLCDCRWWLWCDNQDLCLRLTSNFSDVTESCGKWLALNRHHGYYDANENWTAHPNETLCRLQAMKKRISSRPGIRACFSVLGKTDFHIFKLPNKTVSFQVGGALGLEAGWSIVTVRHNFNNNRTDKVCICSFRYNFAPIS